MNRFVAKFADKIIGVLSGFDRLVLRGTLRSLAFTAGMMSFLWRRGVLLKDFGPFAERLTAQLKQSSLQAAHDLGRPVIYLPSSATNKEQVARKVADEAGLTEGLIAVLSCVEPCVTFTIFRNREQKRLELLPRRSQCLHLYHYFIDPLFGFMHARIQTWLPFSVQVCLNGREWLARQLDRCRLGYRRRDNCFVQLDDLPLTQRLATAQLTLNWPRVLRRIARLLNPAHHTMLPGGGDYYWSAHQSEWATDIMFRDSAALVKLYPALVLHGITGVHSPDVMRFLGRRVTGAFAGEIVSDFKDRPEGVRIKHRAGANSVKLYDKQGSVLRVETTLNDPHDFRVFRPKEGDPDGAKAWRPLRKGIADLHRRAEVSQAANDRYLDALAAVTISTPIAALLLRVCRPATDHAGRRARPLRPWSQDDLALLKAISHGEFAVNGLRNRDLQRLLFPGAVPSAPERRRRSAKVSRLLRLLRAHGILRKVPKTHRYLVTQAGRDLISAVVATERATPEQLAKAAA